MPKQPCSALLFVSTLFLDWGIFRDACHHLEGSFGEVIMESPTYAWEYSKHYAPEMGEGLLRRYVFFGRLIDQGEIAAIKLKTNALEQRYSVDGRRRINLDPGYLTMAKVVLASTKDYSHRIYLGEGIFAEITMMQQKGRLAGALNCYRDYQDEQTLRVFSLGRVLYDILLADSPSLSPQH
ncbi:MAG TPA: DUF4416 family protein [Dissulfurispiraceae bacterium]|nr:DUF4416 family protein [Dissulfurispiraceae bacterium]